MTTPTTEPQSITAGETIAWTKSVPDFPATTHVLKYALQLAGQTSLITITATASGATHSVSVAIAVSVLYAPGVYLWTSYAENLAGTTRDIVERGRIPILASPLAALASTHATRTLALIDAALENRIPNGLESTSIDGQQLDRIPIAQLSALQVKYQQKVAAEQNRAALTAGLGNRRNHFARFTRPT